MSALYQTAAKLSQKSLTYGFILDLIKAASLSPASSVRGASQPIVVESFMNKDTQINSNPILFNIIGLFNVKAAEINFLSQIYTQIIFEPV